MRATIVRTPLFLACLSAARVSLPQTPVPAVLDRAGPVPIVTLKPREPGKERQIDFAARAEAMVNTVQGQVGLPVSSGFVTHPDQTAVARFLGFLAVWEGSLGATMRLPIG